MLDLSIIRSFFANKHDDVIVDADELGFVVHKGHRFLTFLQDAKYLGGIISNEDIVAVLYNDSIEIEAKSIQARLIPVSDARLAFSVLHNSLRSHYADVESYVSSSAKIDSSVQIPSRGVYIGDEVLIEPNVVIYPGTTISQGAVIRSGAIIGSEALDIREVEDGPFLMSNHLGRVHIGEYVEVGNNSVVDRAIFRHQTTSIGFSSKIGCLVNISHGVKVGAKNKIAGGVQICGGTQVGDNNWFGPKAVVSHMLNIGSNVFVSLGSVVLKDLGDGWKVVNSRVFQDRHPF